MGASKKMKQRGTKVPYTSKKQEETKKQRQNLKSAFCFLSATFQFTIVNSERLYLLDFLLNLSEISLDGKLRKSDSHDSSFMPFGAAVWEIWDKRYSTRRMGQFLQHLEKWLQLTYYLMKNS